MKKILIVDDSKAVHSYLKDCFKDGKYQIEHVFNGQEAFDKVKSQQKYDLILLDWEMPVMTGPEFAKKIRSENVPTPIVMMTTKNAVEDIKFMLENGASEYMMKPFTKDILFEKVQTVLGE